MKYIIATAFAAFLLLALLQEKQIKRERLASGAKILAFGDSLTFGHGVGPSQSYPAILSQLSGYEVLNQGVSAEVSSRGRSRLPALLKDGDIKLLILCHGGNDILRRQSTQNLKANLKAMIEMAKSKGIEVLLIGVPDISLTGLSTLSLYEELAKEYDTLYIEDMLEDILSDSSLKGDRIHPNVLGYHKMAEEIDQKLRDEKILP